MNDDYEISKITIDGATYNYDDDTTEYEYRASLVPTAAVIPETLDHPTMLDTTIDGYKVLNLTAELDQFDDQINARLEEDAQKLAEELIVQGIKVNASGNTELARDEELKRLFRLRFRNQMLWRIRNKQQARDCTLFLYDVTLPKGSAPGTYKIEKITHVMNLKKIEWEPEVTESAEKTVKEIMDDPYDALQKSKMTIIGKPHTPHTTPIDVLDAHPELKKEALSKLIDPEGGIQPIWNVTYGNFKSIAVTQETESGLRIKGIGQLGRSDIPGPVYKPLHEWDAEIVHSAIAEWHEWYGLVDKIKAIVMR